MSKEPSHTVGDCFHLTDGNTEAERGAFSRPFSKECFGCFYGDVTSGRTLVTELEVTDSEWVLGHRRALRWPCH